MGAPKYIYFLGIGGIGMSALARYYRSLGLTVAGYDKTSTTLTSELVKEGIDIHFIDDVNLIPSFVTENASETLIVYTPAIPVDHNELKYLKANSFTIKKRSEVLATITGQTKTIAIAGTHGKTTTSSMVAHLLKSAGKNINAFLGGITQNYNTNLLLSTVQSPDTSTVVEADEYDRSFLTLFPEMAIITSVDADHLDVYGEHKFVRESFELFANQIKPGGVLVSKKGLDYSLPEGNGLKIYSYSLNEKANFYAENIKIENGNYVFDLRSDVENIKDINFGIPGSHNVENAVAASAIAQLAGLAAADIKKGLKTFKGVKRRFDYQLKTSRLVYIDDYAHHPEELRACISSVKEMYPGKKIVGVFQPHLYTRTRDFADGFAKSLQLLDDIILLDIYPARELPIPGISSQLLFNKINTKNKLLATKQNLVEIIKNKNPEVLITMGAGDIDTLVEPISKMLKEKINSD
jgi:UDP-N-acetylmuramate--alanine ligase